MIARYRRIRRGEIIRDLVAETAICSSQLILPIFITDHANNSGSIDSMQGVGRHSINSASSLVEDAKRYGIKTFALFPYVQQSLKTEDAKEAFNPRNLTCRAIYELKKRFGKDIIIIADVALDPYTTSGHDGLLKDEEVVNDRTIEILCKQALVLAASGADMVAPSDMMDGRIEYIRSALDSAEFEDVAILSYSAKYASCLYRPFRSAIGSAKDLYVDKRSYQLDCRSKKEAIKEVKQDIKEGADIVIVKPATFYLDIISKISDNFDVPVFAYQVSGEYQIFKSFGGFDAILESLIAIKRAGATSIFTYAAIEIAKQIRTIK